MGVKRPLGCSLQSILTPDISRIRRIGNNLLRMYNLRVFVYHLAIYDDVIPSKRSWKYDTVLHHSALLDDTSTSDYGILNRTFNQASVGYD